MTGWQTDLKSLLRGFVVTLAIAGAIATFSGVLYLGVILLLGGKGDLFQALIVPGLKYWIVLGALVQTVLWVVLAYIRLIPQQMGRNVAIIMAVLVGFSAISSFFVPK